MQAIELAATISLQGHIDLDLPETLRGSFGQPARGLLLLDAPAPSAAAPRTIAERRAALRTALAAAAAVGVFADIEDPVAWQRAERADRPLPGRDA
jgi:hypothetical protein